MSTSTALGASAPSPVAIPSSAVSPSLWDRISNWASEHKAAVYTIAGVTLVVTGAGVVYYLSEPKTPAKDEESATGGKSKKKKNKRKTSKQAEKEGTATPEKAEPGVYTQDK